MRRRMGAISRSRDERGAAAVETALCLGVIVLPLIFAMIAYGYMFSFREALSQATTEGARSAVGATSASSAQTTAQDTVTKSLGQYGMKCSGGNLLDSANKDVGDCTTTISPASCTPSTGLVSIYVGATTTPAATPCKITLTVTHLYRDNSLLPSVPLLDFTLPSKLSFTSVVTVG